MKDSNSAPVDVSPFLDWREIAKFETRFSTLWAYVHPSKQQLEVVSMSDDGKSITTSLDRDVARALYEALKREFHAEEA